MRPRESGGSNRPGPSIYSIINNHDGEVLLPGQQGTWVYIQTIADNIRNRRNIPREDIRIIDMEQNRAYMLSGQPAHSASQPTVGGEQSSDANYEIIDRNTRPAQPVFRFIANTDEEATRKFQDWLRGAGYADDDNTWVSRYGWRRIEGRPAAEPVPGSTQDRINQRMASQGGQEYQVSYTLYDQNSGRYTTNTVQIDAPNANAAMDGIRSQLESRGLQVYSIDAEPVASTPAQGTESLPAGNTRWLVLDQNDREVYSFVHRSNQGEANQYAANWLRQNGLLGQGEYMVVPAR